MSEPEEVCGRCGHPKAEHVDVAVSDSTSEVLVCPTALFLKDQLAAIVNEP